MAAMRVLVSTICRSEMQKTSVLARAFDRGQGRRRSVDLRFFRPALYRLSYLTSQTVILANPAGGNDGI